MSAGRIWQVAPSQEFFVLILFSTLPTFIHQIFIQCLLGGGHCSMLWGQSNEQNGKKKVPVVMLLSF